MKKILTLILLLSSVATYAQQTETAAESKYGPFLTNKFFDNWFLSVGGGAQVFFGEFDGELGLGDRIAPAFDVSLGKWITPAIGLRGQFAGLKVKGAVMGLQGRYREGATGTANLYEENFSMFNLHGDLLWNISNTIAGYNPSRFWSFVPFAG
ncbi:MAG: hypothetical protein M0P27_10925, partial [Bacteroidales bacterium]|nr:hypothetical protein [Bacteroidales bacterium]